MNKTTWLTLFLFVCACNIAFAMDKKVVSKRWQEMAMVLPDLVGYDGLPITQSQYSGMSFVNDHKIKYFYALQPESPHPLDFLEKVAMPMSVDHDDLIGGVWKKRNGVQKFRLACLARGVLLQSQGDSSRAEQAFKEAESSVHSDFSYEKAIGHAATCCRLLLNNQHDYALDELFELQKFLKTYPCWKQFASHLRTMFIDAHHLPAIEKLALSGDVDAQFHLVQAACAQAVAQEDVAAQCSQFKLLVPYFESLIQRPEHNALAKSLIQYTAAAGSYERKQYPQATQLLIELLKHSHDEVPLTHVNQLAHSLLEAVALQGDVRARCYTIPQQLQSTQQKVRRAGIERAGVLMQELIRAGEKYQIACFDECGIVTQLEEMARKENGTACVLLAQWKCYQALADMVTSENAELTKARHHVVKLYAQLGLDRTKQQLELLKALVRYADGVIAFCDGNLEVAAQQFIAAADTGTIENELDGKIRNKASQFLVELKDKGEWRARCRDVLQRVSQDAKNKQTQEQCCTLASDFLERAPKELYTQECGDQLVKALNAVVTAGNDDARYRMGHLRFRLIHDKHEETGLDDASISKLDEVFKLVGAASKAGVKEATPFVRAVMLYRGAHGLLKKELYDNAVEQLLGLLDVPLSERDKALCKAFAEHQLVTLAQAGNSCAGGWHIATLLETGDQEEMVKGLSVCARVFPRFLELDTPNFTIANWQKALESFKKFAVVEKLEKILHDDKYIELHGEVAYILSSCYVLQTLIPYVFMEAGEGHRALTLLTSAVALAKRAHERADRKTADIYRKQWGMACYRLGYHYLENHNMPDAMTALCEGSRLQHPGCMRAASVLALMQPPVDGQRMDKRMFKAHIATIERAYNMGDKEAGAILAEHYYDGQANPFACGHFLEQDIKKSLTLAHKIGGIYPQTACILGHFEYRRLTNNQKNTGQKLNLSVPVKLLMDAAAGNQQRAYVHLQEIYLSRWCTQEAAQGIVQFLELKSDEHVPEALCALGSILINDMRHVDTAIRRFEEAAYWSNDMLGHFDLASIYAMFEQNNGKREIFKAADHCIAMIEAGARRGSAHVTEGKLTAFILELLLKFEGTAEEKQRAKELCKVIQERLASVGVFAVVSDQAVPQVVQQVSRANDQENVHEVKFLTDVMGAIGSAACQEIVGDPAAIERVRVNAAEGNAFAQHVMSQVSMHFGKTGIDARGTSIDRKTAFMAAVNYAMQALLGDKTNTKYREQFEYAYYQLIHYLRTSVIPDVVSAQVSLVEVLEIVNQGLEVVSSHPELCPQSAQKINQEALACIRALACRGCVPALEMYLKTHLYENEAAQDYALEIIGECCSVVSGQGSAMWEESGIASVLKEHIDHIVKLVESKKNGLGALALSLWYAAEFERMPFDHDKARSQTQAAVDCVWTYCVKAKEWGCTEAIPVWSMMRLSRPEKMSDEECEQALAALETVVHTNVSAAEFIIKLYREGGQLPCGYTVAIDYAHAKRIAEQVKHESRQALFTLAVIAKEQHEHEQFLDYALALYQDGAYALSDLINNCMEYAVFPQALADHLEVEYKAGNMEALRALLTMRSHRKEFEKSIALLEESVVRGSTAEYLELALLYLDPEFSGCNVQKALGYLKLRIEALKKEQCVVQDIETCVDRFAAGVLVTVGIAAVRQNHTLKNQALEAISVVIGYAAECIGQGYASVDLLCVQLVDQCNHEPFDYTGIVATFERILALSKVHPRPIDRDNILCCYFVILQTYEKFNQKRNVSREIRSQVEMHMGRLVTMLIDSGIEMWIN